MNYRVVSYVLAVMLAVLGLSVGLCAGVSVWMGDDAATVRGLLKSALVIMLIAGLLAFLGRRHGDIERREGFGIVTFGWLVSSIAGALPFLMTGSITGFIPACFESMSGFTTTGASVIPDPSLLPKGVLLWRAMTHFYGGMGVLVLCVAILPLLGSGGMQIFRAEVPGPTKDRLAPRIATTAKLLWAVYVLLVVAQTVLLRLGGMSWFDGVCHSFATIATGGFSTQTISIEAYHSAYIEIVVTVFMVLASMNFALHYRLLRGETRVWFRDDEWRLFMAIFVGASLFIGFDIWRVAYPHLPDALRAGFFQAASIMSTTGFSSTNFDLWPASSKILLILLMFIGGCAGSTTGGVKVVRLHVMLSRIRRDIRLFFQPHAVLRVKLNGDPLGEDVVSSITSFLLAFGLIYALSTLAMAFFVPDLVTASTATIACMGNVGPGLAGVGPLSNYSGIPTGGQALLIVCMLIGRLEFYTVLVLLVPSFWRKRI